MADECLLLSNCVVNNFLDGAFCPEKHEFDWPPKLPVVRLFPFSHATICLLPTAGTKLFNHKRMTHGCWRGESALLESAVLKTPAARFGITTHLAMKFREDVFVFGNLNFTDF